MTWNELDNQEVIAAIGKYIKKLRLERNITQEDIAKLAGVGVVSINKIESGKSVTMSILVPVIRELGLLVKFGDFFGDPIVTEPEKQRKRARY
jgi:transcriptional regulator with XRE-family HTH domain